MACYKFYQDTKHTIWQRTRFTVEAPTEEEAIRKAAALIEDGEFDAEPEDDHIRIGEPELLFDTFSVLSTEENDGEATVEIYSGTPRGGRMIAENRDGAAWDTWWLELDAEDMERITGLRRSDFSMEKDCEDFIAACIQWWNSHSETEKIAVWKKYREQQKESQ